MRNAVSFANIHNTYNIAKSYLYISSVSCCVKNKAEIKNKDRPYLTIFNE